MQPSETVQTVLDRVDAKDTEGFLALLDPSVRFRFGNAPVVVGHDALRELLAGFFPALQAIDHTLIAAWRQGHDLFCHGEVCYQRLDGTALTVPFANLFRFEGERIAEYLIFVDNSALFASA